MVAAPRLLGGFLLVLILLDSSIIMGCREVDRAASSELAGAANDSGKALEQFKEHFRKNKDIPADAKLGFLDTALSEKDAKAAKNFLWEQVKNNERADRQKEIEAKTVTAKGVTMRYETRVFGNKPKKGRSLYISLHGGGSVATEENDQQWRNQIDLYKPEEGLYLAPRSPSDTWDMWHKEPIDALIERLITNYVVTGEVNPDRVFLMGYSAGGDGVYQLAPRLADHFAGAYMGAGHPGNASPLNLRNIGFAAFVGEHDTAYDRAKIVAEWGSKLDELQAADKDGYKHVVRRPEGKGHWMELADAPVVMPFLKGFTRSSTPKTVVWRQNDKTKNRFYWLTSATPANNEEIKATIRGQKIELQGNVKGGLTVRLADGMVNYGKDVELYYNGKKILSKKPVRTLKTIYKTMMERLDPNAVYTAEFVVQ